MTDRPAYRSARPRIARTAFNLAASVAVAVAMQAATGAAAGAAHHPDYDQMLAAAHAVQDASGILYAEKEARGLLPPPGADPNHTGMIGFQYTTMTTTPGELPAKRATTNPDFAAALVRLIAGLELAPATPAVVVLSGSYVGGDVAMIAALEQLKLRPFIIVSIGTSQWGATNPEFNILDMLALLRQRGVIQSHTKVAVLGGLNGAGSGMDEASRAALHVSAARDNIPVVDTQPLGAMIDDLVARARSALGGEKPGVVINVGGAIIGPGTCDESFEFPPGLTTTPVPCTRGTPGVLMRLSSDGTPVIHILNMKLLTEKFGLPYDPVPLPTPGKNPAVYGPG